MPPGSQPFGSRGFAETATGDKMHPMRRLMVALAASAAVLVGPMASWAEAAEGPVLRPPPVLEYAVAALAVLLTLATICIPSRRRLR